MESFEAPPYGEGFRQQGLNCKKCVVEQHYNEGYAPCQHCLEGGRFGHVTARFCNEKRMGTIGTSQTRIGAHLFQQFSIKDFIFHLYLQSRRQGRPFWGRQN